MKKWLTLSVLMALVIACTEQKQPTKEVKKPTKHQVINGIERSELALTMRYLYDELVLTRDSIKAGESVSRKLIQRVKQIHDDTPTEADKADETYHAMADLFIDSYATFETDTARQVETFNAMIETCVACHQQKCPGPVKTIKKLKISGVYTSSIEN